MKYNIEHIQRIIDGLWDSRDGDAEVLAHGLCGSFAIAAVQALGSGSYWGIGPSGNPSLHFFAEHNGIYFDGDGAYSNKEDLFLESGLWDASIEERYGAISVVEKIDLPYGQSVGEEEINYLTQEIREIVRTKLPQEEGIPSIVENVEIATVPQLKR